MKSSYSFTELEAAINYWRTRSPSTGEEQALCSQAAALAEPYALMIFNRQAAVAAETITPQAREALAQWHTSLGL